MKLQANLAIMMTSIILMSGCATTNDAPSIQDSSSAQTPSIQQQNQAKLQSAVYQ